MIGEKAKKLVFIGSDHAGFKVKEELKSYIGGKDFDVTDLGCFSEEPVDYPDIAREVSEKVYEHDGSFGILICGSGVGMSMAANKMTGIRAVLAGSEEVAELSRKHNDANVLALGARVMEIGLMKKVVDKFLSTDFEKGEERHVKRVEKMNGMGS